MAIVELPPSLQKFTNGQKKIKIECTNVREMIQKLETLFPGFKEKLLSPTDEIFRYVSIFVNQEDCKYLNGINTSLKNDSKVTILIAMAGG